MTLGYAISECQNHPIDGVINLGPLDCMPTKIADAQFFHFAVEHKIPVLTLPLDGQLLDLQPLDNFVFEISARHNHQALRFHPTD